ncbi:hypothetical protein VFPPC_16581 [Pochonia chlamydosporia 170]|uniref:Uncharacterized protein n=1 Tax=Pochonia chlamydosporia 170 TaxID=1380566 RepID=A0A179FA40_METCM|nr:hypothetical protein VFPPC_16581 [Pochonia chlamydosporia 170]OAQ61943.1 hypothetical protein VFPPC_16581 [Pochonia chlamydosporia 170]
MACGCDSTQSVCYQTASPLFCHSPFSINFNLSFTIHLVSNIQDHSEDSTKGATTTCRHCCHLREMLRNDVFCRSRGLHDPRKIEHQHLAPAPCGASWGQWSLPTLIDTISLVGERVNTDLILCWCTRCRIPLTTNSRDTGDLVLVVFHTTAWGYAFLFSQVLGTDDTAITHSTSPMRDWDWDTDAVGIGLLRISTPQSRTTEQASSSSSRLRQAASGRTLGNQHTTTPYPATPYLAAMQCSAVVAVWLPYKGNPAHRLFAWAAPAEFFLVCLSLEIRNSLLVSCLKIEQPRTQCSTPPLQSLKWLLSSVNGISISACRLFDVSWSTGATSMGAKRLRSDVKSCFRRCAGTVDFWMVPPAFSI